ncbi:MAG: phenylalanine--tRNA ligase subunit beta [Patescibacteria group bacterium]|mgnify:CR=1 FL=1
MKVSKKWLSNFFDAKLPNAEALAEALTFHAFEIDGVEKIGSPRRDAGAADDEASDDVLDVKVTPNRGHDCLSHRGIAKELSAILDIPLAQDPFELDFDLSKKTDEVTVSIEDSKLCPRYIARYIKGVKVGPAPEWLKTSLESIGQRSINNVVDATNLVMFNIGQPLHAFDADRLGSLDIGVRLAREGEELETLDEKKYPLKSSMLLITAGDRAVGIAGIKGGMADKIDENTKNIILESANFDGVSIRKSSQVLKLRTDASARFEQVLSPELCAYGMRQAVKLILDIAGGECAGFVDVYPEPQKQVSVKVSLDEVNKILGTTLKKEEVARVFTRLGFTYQEKNGVFEVTPPLERLDINIKEDLVEEVGRIVGYEKIPAVELPDLSIKPEISKNFYRSEMVRQFLTKNGFSEVFTSAFSDRGERVVANKVDGVRPYLRDNLLPGLTEALERNVRNKELLGLKQVRIFEIGTIWKDGKEEVSIELAAEKMKTEKTKEEWEQELNSEISKSEKEPEAYQTLSLSGVTRYKSFSKFPYVVRDIAFFVPRGTSPDEVLKIIYEKAGELCVRAELFDTFDKGEKTSLAFRLVFQSFERTLKDPEVNEIMEKVSSTLSALGFEVR